MKLFISSKIYVWFNYFKFVICIYNSLKHICTQIVNDFDKCVSADYVLLLEYHKQETS
jgi:hypothetical protein